MLVMNIIDSVSNEVSSVFSQTIPTMDLLLSLLVAITASLIINFVYKKTYVGVTYMKTFSLSIILLCMVTSLVIRTINSNLSLSLGMVGALSIVRFRAAVKDPVDIVFMFWSIAAGIMSGAGLYFATLLACLIIGISYFVCYSYQVKKTDKALLVIKTYSANSDEILSIMNKSTGAKLKTESYKNGIVEFTYELANRSQADEILKFKDSEGIVSLSLLDLD